MANVLSLAMRINADASGFRLDPVQRALVNLGNEADKLNGAFSRFAGSSEAAARAQERTAAQSQSLINSLRDGTISSTQFAAQFEQLTESVRSQAAALERGAEITRKYTTEEQRRAAQIAELESLVKNQAISEETYQRALADVSGASTAAAAAERQRVAVLSEGARVTEANLTADEKRSAELQRFAGLLEQGAISAQTYARAVAGVSADVNVTPQQRFGEAVAALVQQLQGGQLTLEEFTRQSREIGDSIASSTPQATRSAQAILELRERFDAGTVSLQQYRDEFARIQSGDIRTTFNVEVLGVREGIEAADKLRNTIDGLSSTQITAAVEVSGQESLDALRAQFDGIDGRQIDAILQVLGVETIEAARDRLAALSDSPVAIEAQLRAVGFESIDAARAALDSLQDRSVDATLQFFGTERIDDAAERLARLDGTTASAFLQATGFESIEEARRRLANLRDVNVTATLELLGVETVDDARARLSALADLRIEPQLRTVGFESIDAARTALESLRDTSVSATLEFLGAASIDDARERLASLDGTSVEAFIRASGFESIDAAQAKLSELRSVDVQATLSLLGVDSIDAAAARLAELGQSSVEVEARLRTAGFEGISEAQDLLDSLEDVNVTATAEVLGTDSIEQLLAVVDSVAPQTIEVLTETNAGDTASKVRSLVEEQEAWQKLMEEGARISAAFRTEEEKRTAELANLDRLLNEGAISQETFARAAAEASGANAAAAAAERERADALRRAAQITEQTLAPLERYDATLVELNAHLAAGRISQETYARATEAAAKGLNDAERAARGLEAATSQIDGNAARTTLQFNELSGIFSALPGPIGNIAGRISGLSSAGEGLARVFSGGLSQGITSVGASVAALVNPFTLAVAGVAAFGAAAAAVAQGLLSLEDRVERLGNIADKLGVSFGFIQTLEESARRSGTSIEAVSAAFGRLQRSVLGVDEESKAAQRSLAELGVTAEELQTLSPEQQYQRIGEALAAIEDPARRTATATALFGRAGAELIPFFNNLPGTVEDFDRLGRALTAIDRRRLDEFGAALDGLQVASQGLGQSLLLPFVGFGEGITNALAEITAGITSIVDPIGRILEPILTQIGRVVDVLGTSLGNLGRIVGAVFEPFAVVVETVSAALEPLLDGIAEFLKSISDGAVRVTEWVVSFTPIGQIAENVGALGETVSRVVTIITTAFGKVSEFIGRLVGRFAELIAQSPLIQTLGKILSSVFGSISSVFQTIANAVGGVVGRLLTMAEQFLGIDNSAKKAAESTTTLGETVTTLTDEEAKQAAERDKFLQGFTDNVSKAIDESAKFGQAGFDAALQYQNSIEELQRQFDKGILNETSFRRAAEQANQAYQEQINTIKQAAAETERKAKAEAAAVQSIIDANLEQMRVDSQFGGDTQRARAADNLIKLQQEQLRVEEQIRQARESGNLEAANALAARLATIDQVAAREEDIASGAKKQREEAARAAEEAAKEAERASKQRAEAESRIREQIAEKEQQLFERQAEIRADQLAELASPRTGSVQVGDIREGGISQFFATLQEDPAISEARKSRAELEKIRKEIAKLNAEKVDILGAPA